jgi:hypothetical protein
MHPVKSPNVVDVHVGNVFDAIVVGVEIGRGGPTETIIVDN